MTKEEEKNLREKLDNEIPKGYYKLGAGNFIAYSGKQGKIEFEVALRREFEKRYLDND